MKQKLPILYLKEDNIFCPQDLGFEFSLQNIKHDFGELTTCINVVLSSYESYAFTTSLNDKSDAIGKLLNITGAKPGLFVIKKKVDITFGNMKYFRYILVKKEYLLNQKEKINGLKFGIHNYYSVWDWLESLANLNKAKCWAAFFVQIDSDIYYFVTLKKKIVQHNIVSFDDLSIDLGSCSLWFYKLSNSNLLELKKLAKINAASIQEMKINNKLSVTGFYNCKNCYLLLIVLLIISVLPLFFIDVKHHRCDTSFWLSSFKKIGAYMVPGSLLEEAIFGCNIASFKGYFINDKVFAALNNSFVYPWRMEKLGPHNFKASFIL